MLEVVDLALAYRDGDGSSIHALAGIDLSVTAGEMVALYGPSGSGKTTLLSIIAALLRPDRGRVLVGDRHVTELAPGDAARYRREDLGFIRQTADLIDGVPMLAQACSKLFAQGVTPRTARREILPLLERLGLGDRLRHKPEQLSTGERQRVAIARALAPGPLLVLADEPTAALDTARSHDVLALLRELCTERGAVLLLATHDERAARYADRAITLLDGQLRPHIADPGESVERL